MLCYSPIYIVGTIIEVPEDQNTDKGTGKHDKIKEVNKKLWSNLEDTVEHEDTTL